MEAIAGDIMSLQMSFNQDHPELRANDKPEPGASDRRQNSGDATAGLLAASTGAG